MACVLLHAPAYALTLLLCLTSFLPCSPSGNHLEMAKKRRKKGVKRKFGALEIGTEPHAIYRFPSYFRIRDCSSS
jgi:hypothetical protein